MIIVISPLASLMEDQTIFLRNLNIKAGSIGDDKSVNVKIEKGECSIVFFRRSLYIEMAASEICCHLTHTRKI